MVTKTRKNKKIKPTVQEVGSNGDDIVRFTFNDSSILVYPYNYSPQDAQVLYKKYKYRKNINIDFSSCKNKSDTDALRTEFVKQFKDAPTIEQLNTLKDEFNLANELSSKGYHISDLANRVMYDLIDVGNNNKISDEKYKLFIEYIKKLLTSINTGDNINTIKKPKLLSLPRIIIKEIQGYNTNIGQHVKNMIQDHDLQHAGWPKEVIELLKNKIPTKRITTSFAESTLRKEYTKFFDEFTDKNYHRPYSKKYRELEMALIRYKTKKDALRTFDKLAEQHLAKIAKEKTKATKEIQKAQARLKNKKLGAARKRIANINGPVDPVARSIAKKRKLQSM